MHAEELVVLYDYKKKKKLLPLRAGKVAIQYLEDYSHLSLFFQKKKNRADPAAKPEGTVSGRNRSRCLLTKSGQRQSDSVASSPGRGQLHLAILDCQLLTKMFFIF